MTRRALPSRAPPSRALPSRAPPSRALGVLLFAACAGGPADPGCEGARLGQPDVPPPPAETAVARAAGADAASAAAFALAAPEVPRSGPCAAGAGVTLFASPRAPRAGQPLRIVAVSATRVDGALGARGPDGGAVALAAERGGGPPYWWYGEIEAPAAGSYRAALGQGSRILGCAEIHVAAGSAEVSIPPRFWGGAWQDQAAWTRAMEDLYSAWIERLFDAPLDQQPSWPALSQVLRDPARNFLHDHLGQGEDDPPPRGLSLDPDCADLPYFLRAYFAFKLALPFGFSSCTRGGGGLPPECRKWRSNLTAPPGRSRGTVSALGDFLRVRVADAVHSGSGRVPSGSDGGDYYPVVLSAESLRPGAVYADPYGHVLVLAKRIPETAGAGGVLLAVDGQPDGTVARRRFWRGNFLFALDPALGSPGWKRFRPVVRDGAALRPLTHDEIARSPDYGDHARDHDLRSVEEFYDRMDAVLSPSPLDPGRAMLETVQALEEQVRGRVLSVKNGQAYKAEEGERIDMPEGAAIFQTVGPWEDFSTPSRDLRLLIAIDIVRGFPARVERRADRYAMPPGKPPAEVRAELERALAGELAGRRIAYPRSDGSERSLSLADVIARAEALEVAYNPNDCAEVRWGAPEGSDEARTCDRRAPWSQRLRMLKYRAWFRERRRPPRE